MGELILLRELVLSVDMWRLPDCWHCWLGIGGGLGGMSRREPEGEVGVWIRLDGGFAGGGMEGHIE